MMRCVYCGEPQSDKRLSCCGEVHYAEDCPACDGNGWVPTVSLLLGPGLHEVTCETCNGAGVQDD